jgi:hypothetical protein
VTHLSRDECLDAAEGTLEAARAHHLESCAVCRQEVGALRAILSEIAEAPVPEPSPLFWEHFSARVREAVRAEAEASPSPRWEWLRWSTLMPMAALAAVVVMVVATLPWDPTRGGGPGGLRSTAAAPGAGASVTVPSIEPVAADLAWGAFAELVGPLDWDTASEAGLAVLPGEAELVVGELSDDERRELMALLTGELARAKS